MIRSSGFSRMVGFAMSMVFSAGVIFFCSFGIISVFQALSMYGLDDMSNLASKDADSIVATITGISIDEDSIEDKIATDVKNIVYNMENKENYSFLDATDDAKRVLGNFFDEFDGNSIQSGFDEMKNSVLNLLSDSKDGMDGE